MKIQLIPALLSLIVAAALSYLVYHIADVQADPNKVIVGVGSVISIMLTLTVALGAKLDNGKVAASLKAWSIVDFLFFFIANLLFAWLGVNFSLYIAFMAVALVIHLWIVWKLSGVDNV